MHQLIASQSPNYADLPCADYKLLAPLKRSAEYGALRPRVANLRPIDAWLEDELHFFVFQLSPTEGQADGETPSGDAPVAVFAMHPASPEPVSAVIVTPVDNNQQAEITDIRRPESSYRVPNATPPDPR